MIVLMKRVPFLLLCICLQVIAYNPTKITVLTKYIGGEADHGHKGAKRSLVDGLQHIGVNFNVNPMYLHEVGDVVHIMAGETFVLDQVIPLKQRGLVKKIIVGPNFGEFCRAGSPYVYDEHIDGVLSLADWTISGFMRSYPDFDPTKIKKWFSGVDAWFWRPVSQEKGRHVLVYDKWQPELADVVEVMLRDYGWIPLRVSYGSYTIDQFKELLQQVQFAVFLSYSESQGLALAESWSMDVPTLVWNCKGPHSYQGIYYPDSSACPFMTPATGLPWKNMQEFAVYLEHIEELLPQFSPRQWVLRHMTDEISVRALLDIIISLDDRGDDVQKNYSGIGVRKPNMFG
jgi:hypothetical protein